MAKLFAVLSILSVAAVIMIFAVALQYAEDREKLRRWERRCNRYYRENPDAVLGKWAA